MQLISTIPAYEEDRTAQRVWGWFSTQLKDVDGLAYYQHPVIRPSGTLPDLVILALGYEPLAVRCLPYALQEITQVGGDTWEVAGQTIPSPSLEVEDYCEELNHLFRRERPLRGLLAARVVLALPNVARSHFHKRFGKPQGLIFLWGDGDVSAALLPVPSVPLSEEQWRLAQAVLQNTTPLRPVVRPTAKRATASTLGETITRLEQEIALLDSTQDTVAVQIPPGPQRIRGLAGTGKTVVLAMRAANLHLRYPERRILFTFYTQSLYSQVQSLITRFFRNHGGTDEPDWSRIHIRHAWGSPSRPGVYTELCARLGARPLDLAEARRQDREVPFQVCCSHLLKHHGGQIEPSYDHILVDEAQDLPADFFRILYELSAPQHAIYFAHDEMQSLSRLEMLSIDDLFGIDEQGQPRVSLEGEYPGGIEKDLLLEKSYRCPLPVMMTAHALGLGLYRPEGCIQMFAKADSWRALGYEVESGGRPGQKTVIHRPAAHSPNPIGRLYDGEQAFVTVRSFAERTEEIEWLARAIKRDVEEEGVRPEHIVVVTLDSWEARYELAELQHALHGQGIESIIPGLAGDAAQFAEPGRVTLATVYRAKGNEAPVLYVMAADQMDSYDDEIEARNRAFSAISRAKGWVRISGAGEEMAPVKVELEAILTDLPRFRFIWPTAPLRTLDAETSRRRTQTKKAKRLAREMQSLDPEALRALSPQERKRLRELLQDA